jgi:hypothetical protein
MKTFICALIAIVTVNALKLETATKAAETSEKDL